MIDSFRELQDISSHYWPMIFIGGTLIVHPFYLLGMRVQCSPFSPSPRQNSNTVNCFNYVLKTQGLSGFYKGYAPSLLLYTLMIYPELRDAASYSWDCAKDYIHK